MYVHMCVNLFIQTIIYNDDSDTDAALLVY